MRSLAFVLLAGLLCQGCLAFPYPTPAVEGSVIDATTKQPIPGAKIAVHHYSYIHCTSTADGSFRLPSGGAWRPCFLLPGDVFFAYAEVTFKAEGYQTFTRRYIAPMGAEKPMVLDQQVELQKVMGP